MRNSLRLSRRLDPSSGSRSRAGEAGSDARLVAAKQLQEELKKILEGEPPYDIFVRWKPIADQPIGWEPDLNDGVSMNIRPFMMATDVGRKGAGILRVKPNIKWDKDRGKEPSRSKDEFPWFWGWDGEDQGLRRRLELRRKPLERPALFARVQDGCSSPKGLA